MHAHTHTHTQTGTVKREKERVREVEKARKETGSACMKGARACMHAQF